MPRRRVDPFDDYDSLSAVDSDADNELDVFDKYSTARTPDIESKRKSTNRCSKPVARASTMSDKQPLQRAIHANGGMTSRDEHSIDVTHDTGSVHPLLNVGVPATPDQSLSCLQEAFVDSGLSRITSRLGVSHT